MNFCWVTLRVKDFKQSLDFYHGLLELSIDSIIDTDNFKMAMLGKKDQAKVEILWEAENLTKQVESNHCVGFEVDNLEKAMTKMEEAGFPILAGPISPEAGVRFSFLRDPNGIQIQLVEHS